MRSMSTAATRRSSFVVVLGALLLVTSVLLHAAWTYEQGFEALTNGDINGQASWTGSALYDVQSSVACTGSKAMALAIPAAAANMFRANDTETTTGSVYFQVRRSGTDDGDFTVIFREDSGNKINIKFGENGDIEIYNGSGYVDLLAGYSANVCYTLQVEWNDATQPDQWRVRIHNGTSWGSFTSWIGMNGTFGAIHGIYFEGENGLETQTAYVDAISTTDPSGGGPPPPTGNTNLLTLGAGGGQ